LPVVAGIAAGIALASIEGSVGETALVRRPPCFKARGGATHIPPVAAARGCARDQDLLREVEEGARGIVGDGVQGFKGSDASEGPAGTAAVLVLDRRDEIDTTYAIISPVQRGGERRKFDPGRWLLGWLRLLVE